MLMHGTTGNSKASSRLGIVDDLKDEYQLILVDARGDGKSDKPRDLTAWEKAKDVVTAANAEQDITHGALWYHANYVSPYWSKTFKEVATIGDHIFYRK